MWCITLSCGGEYTLLMQVCFDLHARERPISFDIDVLYFCCVRGGELTLGGNCGLISTLS